MRKHAISFKDSKHLTKQSMRDECNINNIMAQYKSTGEMPHMANNPGAFGDFDSPLDFQTAQNKVISAQQAFDSLSANVRRRFENDPGQLLNFLDNPENFDESVQLGLRSKPEPEPVANIVPEDMKPIVAKTPEGGETDPATP